MKRVIALVLTLSIAMTLFAFNVFAATPTAAARRTSSKQVSNVTISVSLDQFGITSNATSAYGTYTPTIVAVQIFNNNTLPALVNSCKFSITTASATMINGYDTFSPDLTLGYFDGTSFEVVPSNEFSYGNGIVVPPKESLYLVGEIDIAGVNSSGSFVANTISAVSISDFTIGLSSDYPYGQSTDFSPIISYLSGYSSSLGDINTNIQALTTALNAFKTANHQDFVNTYGRLGQMLTKLTILESIETLLTTIENNTDDVETLLTSIDGNVEDISTDIDSLITKLNNIYTSLEYFSTRNHNDIADIEGQLGSIYTRLGLILTQLTYSGTIPNSGYINSRSQRSTEVSDTYYTANTQIRAFGSYLLNADYEAVFPSSYYLNYAYCIPIQVYFRIIVKDDLKFNYVSIDLLDFSNSFSGTVELSNFFSSSFSDTRLYLQDNTLRLGVFGNGNLVPGMYYFNAWVNLYVMNATTVPQFPQNITITLDGISKVTNSLSDQSNSVAQQSDSIHQQEEVWYNQNKQAMESVGLSNFQYTQQQYNGILGVTFQFEQLWNALGSWNLVYIFTLLLSLATFILRHRPSTKMQQRMEENKFWANSNRTYRMIKDPEYAKFIQWRARK